VLRHCPDLVIVCFGLNDVNGDKEVYLAALAEIFRKCLDGGSEVVFLTPNMLNTRVADDTPSEYFEYAHKSAERENGGRMDDYIYSGKALAEEMGVLVCDCYSEWKRLAETKDTTLLLANRINHPTPTLKGAFYETFPSETRSGSLAGRPHAGHLRRRPRPAHRRGRRIGPERQR
jgi:hypothetical protein